MVRLLESKFASVAAVVLLLCAAGALAAERVSGAVVLSEVTRNIDLTTQQTRVAVQLKVANRGSAAQDYFLLANTPAKAAHLAFAAAKQGQTALKISPATVADSADVFHKVEFATPLKGGESVSLALELVYVSEQIPHPAEISQADPQLVVFRDNHYFYTPYTVETQTTVVKLFSNENYAMVESHTEHGKTSLSRDVITYGPYKNVAGNSVSEMKVHFENSSPFLEADVEREIWISHWGTVSVEESYKIYHTGGKLKGSFSRLDFQRGARQASVRAIRGQLPYYAQDIYYRDRIGNISTSHVFVGSDAVDVELSMRYPLFGGWHSEFYWGYNMPSSHLLAKTDDGFFQLDTPLSIPFSSLVIRSLTVTVVLPEGASFESSKVDTEVERLADGKIVSFLDSAGRPTVSFRKLRVTGDHAAAVLQVKYAFSAIKMLREPLALVASLAAIFVAGLLILRLDFSIGTSSSSSSSSSSSAAAAAAASSTPTPTPSSASDAAKKKKAA